MKNNQAKHDGYIPKGGCSTPFLDFLQPDVRLMEMAARDIEDMCT